MTKKQKKERALLMIAYSFLFETFKRIDKNITLKEKTEFDLKLENIYKKLFNLRKTLMDKKIVNFFFERVGDLSFKDVDLMLVALLILEFYKEFNETKEIKIDDDFLKMINDIAVFLKENNESIVLNNSIDLSIEIFLKLYPDKQGLFEFRKMTNRFPYNIKQKE